MNATSDPVTPVRPAPCDIGSFAVHTRGSDGAKGTVLLVENDATIHTAIAAYPTHPATVLRLLYPKTRSRR